MLFWLTLLSRWLLFKGFRGAVAVVDPVSFASQVRYISETHGLPPDDMLNCGTKTKKFFVRSMNVTASRWRLKVWHSPNVWPELS